MGSLFDYLNWRGDLSFSQSEVNEVDGMIFSLISYVDFWGIVPSSHESGREIPLRAALNAFFSKNPTERTTSMGLMISNEFIRFLKAVKETKRFRNVLLKTHVNQIDPGLEMQFSATTFLPGDGSALIAFRGTDDTLIGWKEDFNMSFMESIPAQRQALSYLEIAAVHFDGDLRLAGHSKGGNLAIYSAVFCKEPIQTRLQEVWSYDGPGFFHKILDDPRYIKARPVLRTLIPQSSIVGILLEHEESYTVVKSRQKGFLQHDGLSWEVMGTSFVHLETVTDDCKRLDKTVNSFLKTMSLEQREQFADALYQLLSVDNALTLTDLVSMKRRWLAKGRTLDPKVYKTLRQTVGAFINVNAKNRIGGLLPKRKEAGEKQNENK